MFEQSQVKFARAVAMVMMSLVLAFTVGCSRDPNVRKQKFLESGKRYEASGKYKEAGIQFSNALKLDHNYAAAHYEMAKTYLKLNSLMPAYGELLKTIDLDPNNLEARATLGNLLLAGNAPDRALSQAQAILAKDPKNADGYALLAGIAERKHDPAEALKNLQKAIQIDPHSIVL
jgi:tetratricopeptide (TPR) repeat protein